jgi:hypothetical protein
MGFIEETGAAQYYRDARILTIYEGTTAIQANDLVGRKTFRDKGHVARLVAEMVKGLERELAKRASPACQSMLLNLTPARECFEEVVSHVCEHFKSDVKGVFAGSVPYLMLSGYLLCAWQMGKALLVAEDKMAEDESFYASKAVTARFYAEHLLPLVPSIAQAVLKGSDSVNALTEELF